MNSGSNFADEMLERLKSILALVIDWLKFAEAKNAVLLGFSGAGITATTTYLSAASNISRPVEIGILVATLFLFVCSIICALSFLPRTELELLIWRRQKPRQRIKNPPNDHDNLYFYGHLYKYDKNELLSALNRLYFDGNVANPNKKEHEDLANQIIINAEIAYLKFRFFTQASYFMIAALACVPICVFINILFF